METGGAGGCGGELGRGGEGGIGALRVRDGDGKGGHCEFMGGRYGKGKFGVIASRSL